MWLRAPDTKGTANLEMLFYYENANGNSNPRYELMFGFYTRVLGMFIRNVMYSTVFEMGYRQSLF
jgi:hypothetical protein